MRYTGSVTSVSWIPTDAVTGVALKMPFEIGLAHYDPPPPDTITDLRRLKPGDLLTEQGAVAGGGALGRLSDQHRREGP